MDERHNLYGSTCVFVMLLLIWLSPWLPVWDSAKTGFPALLTLMVLLVALFIQAMMAFMDKKCPKWFNQVIERVTNVNREKSDES